MIPGIHILHVPGFDTVRDENVAALAAAADVCVHADPERNGLLRNWLSALRCENHDSDSSWSVILSDDAIPFGGWKNHLEAALKHTPAQVDFLGLTHFSDAGQILARRGAAYGVSAHAIWGGGAAYRTEHLAPLADFGQVLLETDPKYGKWDDGVVAAYNLDRGGLSALATRAIFDQPYGKSTLGHSPRRGHPALTILDAGPWWGGKGRAIGWNNPIREVVFEAVRDVRRARGEKTDPIVRKLG